jgi:hypothetical protein
VPELEQTLSEEALLNIDETGWRTNGEKRFLWAFVAAQYVVYSIASTRGSALLIQVLGAVFEGILCSDTGSADTVNNIKAARHCAGRI